MDSGSAAGEARSREEESSGGATGRARIRGRSRGLRRRIVDDALTRAWRRCLPAGSGLSLFAVGGYGRGELFPCSDIDVLVLGEPARQQAGHEALSRFFALLWDAGVPVSHAVRSPAECTQACADDQSVMTALIEARAKAFTISGFFMIEPSWMLLLIFTRS